METMTMPGTGWDISKIAYGCMEIGGGWNQDPISDLTRKEAMEAVRTSLEEGVNFFDHADIYCMGKSEEVFSMIWGEHPGLRDQIILQTKCGIRFAGDPDETAPHRFDFSYEHILESVEGSLKRLKTDYLDILLLHRPDPLVEPEQVARAFDELYRSGKVRFFGVSNHTAAQIALLQTSLDQPLVANQVELNVLHTHLLDEGIDFNQDFPPQPVRGDGTLEYCRLHGIAIQAWAPLAGGVVTGKHVDQPTQSMVAVSNLVEKLSKEKNVKSEAILISWLLKHPAHIQPIIGTTNPERIRAACQGSSFELTREEWYRLFTAGRGAALP